MLLHSSHTTWCPSGMAGICHEEAHLRGSCVPAAEVEKRWIALESWAPFLGAVGGRVSGLSGLTISLDHQSWQLGGEIFLGQSRLLLARVLRRWGRGSLPLVGTVTNPHPCQLIWSSQQFGGSRYYFPLSERGRLQLRQPKPFAKAANWPRCFLPQWLPSLSKGLVFLKRPGLQAF